MYSAKLNAAVIVALSGYPDHPGHPASKADFVVVGWGETLAREEAAVTEEESSDYCRQVAQHFAAKLAIDGHDDCEIGMGLMAVASRLLGHYVGVSGDVMMGTFTSALERVCGDYKARN